MPIAVLCEVEPGLRPSERTVGIPDVYGRKEYLRIEGDYLQYHEGRAYFPVGLIYEHAPSDSALVELPFEADSGAQRLFVPRRNILRTDKRSA